MSEKRFTDIVCSETGHIGVTDCGIDKEFNSDEFEDFLNELNNENMILKSELSFSQNQNRELRKVLKDNRSMAEVVEDNKELKKENEKLKKQVEDCRDYNAILYKNCIQKDRRWLKRIKRVEDELEEENEQLRKELDCFHPVMFQDMRKGTVVLYLKELK